MVAACPAARNPSTRVSGISATISMTGGMYLCAESTKKFGAEAPRSQCSKGQANVPQHKFLIDGLSADDRSGYMIHAGTANADVPRLECESW